MSLPTPNIQALSTYRREWRASSANRNISSPYNLAIPLQQTRSSTTVSSRPDTRTSTRPSIKSGPSYNTLYLPKSPKKVVLASEKPVRPYAYDRKSSLTVFTGCQHETSYSPIQHRSRIGVLIEDRMLAIFTTLAIAIVLAIALPLAIILPQKMIKPLPINVLIPFYVYPAPGAWDVLYDAIVSHADTNFTVIINPDNGPGPAVWPPGEYITVIKALNVYPNVQTLGYIDTAGGSRDNATVRKEIETYAGWADVSKAMSLHGIYFDHTPYQGENDTLSYMKNITETVRSSKGFGDRTLVVQNPGRVPEASLLAFKPNITVVFEGSYADMPRKQDLKHRVQGLKEDRENFAMLVQSVPQNLGRVGLRKIIDDVRRDVEWLLLTDLTENVYELYGSLLKEWLDVSW